MELVPGGSITGTVDLPVGADTADVAVVAFRAEGFALTFPEPDGTYELSDLPPGEYLVGFDTAPGSGLVPEFSDDSLLPAGGDLVTVVSGVETSGVDAALELCAPPFSDVPTAQPFCIEINWLLDSGITGGFPDGTFRPSATVTRQAMAAFLFRDQVRIDLNALFVFSGPIALGDGLPESGVLGRQFAAPQSHR